MVVEESRNPWWQSDGDPVQFRSQPSAREAHDPGREDRERHRAVVRLGGHAVKKLALVQQCSHRGSLGDPDQRAVVRAAALAEPCPAPVDGSGTTAGSPAPLTPSTTSSNPVRHYFGARGDE